MLNHIEYIHYNPVKHGFVQFPNEWKYSSFHRYVKDGIYARDWGKKETITFAPEIGHE